MNTKQRLLLYALAVLLHAYAGFFLWGVYNSQKLLINAASYTEAAIATLALVGIVAYALALILDGTFPRAFRLFFP